MILKRTGSLLTKLAPVWPVVQLACMLCSGCAHPARPGVRAYYLSASGNDEQDGSLSNPWKTMGRLNRIYLLAGDSVFFAGGESFSGNMLIDSNSRGSATRPLLISSYGNGHAKINGGNGTALVLYRTQYVLLKNLDLKGSGRKSGNTKDGISVIDCAQISMDSLDISGFQKSGLLIYASVGILTSHITAHENGEAGITIEGGQGKRESRNIQIRDCQAENNPGDPVNLNNHSGNGIIAGHSTRVLIDHCTATNNGWDMPRTGNGPVGIWCYESDSVTIQYCLAYRNKTSAGGADGGGFDLDGGVTNSLIQYCFSYGNQGSGYCLFQYAGASPWFNNIIRYNISENDGLVSESRAGLFIWNSSDDAGQFHDALVYNNTVYNDKEAVIHFSEKSERKRFGFYNNIFVGRDSLVLGNKGEDIFQHNNWWSLKRKTGKMPGSHLDPHFAHPGATGLTSFSPTLFRAYDLPSKSVLRQYGVNIQQLLKPGRADPGLEGKRIPVNAVGAGF